MSGTATLEVKFENSASEVFQELFAVFNEIGKVLESNHRGYFKGQIRKKALPWTRPMIEVRTEKDAVGCKAVISCWMEPEHLGSEKDARLNLKFYLERALSKKGEKKILRVIT